MIRRLTGLVVCALMALAVSGFAGHAADDVSVWCSGDAKGRSADVKAICDVRSTTRAAIKENEITLTRSGGRDLSFDFVAFQPRVNASAILFLIQTGGKSHPNDSAREIKRLIRHEGRRQFGVYTIAGDVTRFTSLGASPEQIDNGLSRRRSRESGSALFTALDTALDDLASLEARRRTIVLLGDGSHDTEGPSEDDIVAKAQRLNIAIHAIAMTDNRVDDTIKDGMKVMRSMAERTGGVFEDAGPRRIVSNAYINDFYHFVENGGEAQIASYLSGGDVVDAAIGLSNGRTVRVANVPVRGTGSGDGSTSGIDTRSSAVADESPSDDDSDDTTETAAVDTSAREDDVDDAADEDADGDGDADDSQFAALLDDPLQWASDNPFPALSALVALLGLGALGVIVLMRPKAQAYDDGYDDYDHGPADLMPEPAVIQVADQDTVLMGGGVGRPDEPVVVPGHDDATRPEAGGVSQPHVHGYLEFLDSDETRAPLSATNVRIGRHRDNDICIANHSVHRQHAVIFKDSDGAFVIRDLGTKNGIIVNNVRCSQQKLNDGDVIELGEVKLRYSAAAV